MRRLDIAPHGVPEAGAGQLDLPLAPGGLVIGQEARQPLVLRFFRFQPTHVAMFAAPYVARILGYRALALGAQVVIVSGRPSVWETLARSAPPGPAWVSVVPPNSPTPPAGSIVRPSLIIDDGGSGSRRDLGPWQTVVSVMPYVTAQALSSLHSFDLLVLQRVAPEHVGPVRAGFNLPVDTAQWLPRMPDDTIAVAERGRVRFANLGVTQNEGFALGQPTRADG